MVDPIVITYVARKVVEDIRQDRIIDGKLAFELHKHPFIHALREELQPTDIDKIIAMAASSTGPSQHLAFSLLNPYRLDPRVIQIVRSTWDKAENQRDKFFFLWRITDLEDLDKALLEELYTFVIDNWRYFLDNVLIWYGGKNKVMSIVRERLSANPSKCKVWLYLCSSLGSNDNEAINKLLEEHRHGDDFTNRVIDDLLRRVR